MKDMRGVLATAMVVVVGIPLVVVMLFVGSNDETPNTNACSSGGSPVNVAAIPSHGIGQWSADQVRNAAIIVQTGAKMGVPARGQVLAVMVAMDESTLTVVRHGDTAASTSLGLFQQIAGWGSAQQRLDPATSARFFYQHLLKVKGWETMEPTLAAHAEQGNLDPYVYAPFWPKAQALVSALTAGSGRDVIKQVAAQSGVSPNAVDANTGAVTTGCGDAGGSGFAVNAAVAYVGAYTPAQLMARAQAFVRANGSANPDPYFHSEPDGSWFRDCQHFVANMSGRATSGYGTASDAWAAFVAAGVAHPADGIDGQAPPPGAWLYYSGHSAAGHVDIYLGNGEIASTDLFGNGKVGIGPASAVATKWHDRYLGWVAPWGTKVPVEAPSAVQNAANTTTGGDLTGSVVFAQANIPQRSGMGGYRASMKRVLSREPDFVTLNEQTHRSLGQLVSAAPGYAAYRDPQVGHDPGASQTLDTAILFRADTWRLVAGGRVKLVDDDHIFYNGPKTWDRFATWVTLTRVSDDAEVSVISVHMPTNPARYGPNKPVRQAKYGAGMDTLVALTEALPGVKLIGGDFNVHASQRQPWAAPSKMAAAGYGWYSQDLDFLFIPAGAQLVKTWTGPMISDHPYIAARIGVAA